MELRHLKYFVAVAEELHFRRAAQILHVAQSALSRQIRQLEREIGVVLFQRSQHKIQLTSAGKTFYDSAQSILKDAKLAITDALAVEHGEAGTIAIGFVSTAAISILPNLLATIHLEMPRADVVLKALSASEQIDDLYRSTIDIGFFHGTLDDPVFDFITASRDRMIVALPEGNRLAGRSVLNLKDLATETAIMPARHSMVGYFEHVRSAFHAAGVQPQRIHHSGQLHSGLLLVGAGFGVSLVPESWRNTRVNGVVYRRLTGDLAPFELLAAWRRDNSSPITRRIITYLKGLHTR